MGESTIDDLAPLQSWMAALFDSDVRVSAPRRLAGGAVQDNWAVDVDVVNGEQAGRHALVLRADAPSAIAASLTRRDEFEVLRAAHLAGVKVPEPLALCEDEAVLGRVFYAMRRIGGQASAHRLVKACSHNGVGAIDGEALAAQLGAELARLHQVRPPFPGLECLVEPDLSPAPFRVATYRAWLDAMPQPRPALEWALRWLERFEPPQQTLALCHGDFRTGNYMVDVDSGTLSGILDWEFAAWSDPGEDIGWFCARCWRFARDEREAGGIGSREAFLRGYASVADEVPDAEQIAYWEVMATVRWAVIALQQGQRHLSGAQRSLELALTARMVPDMELDALNQIERLSGLAK